jgi:hypothetical protein
MLYEEMGVRPSSVDSQHPACLPDVSLYRQSLPRPLYLMNLQFSLHKQEKIDPNFAPPHRRRSKPAQTGVTGFLRSENRRSFSA